MKKLFFFATAALVLASCNNDVTISENTALVGSNAQKEIGFYPLAQSPKRIANNNHGYINGTTFATDWAMTVTAVDVAKTTAFFDSTTFVYNATPGMWEGLTHRYWPLSPVQVNFLAIAHANADNKTGVTYSATNSDHKFVIAMEDNYPYSTAQRDLIFAIGNGQVTQNGNALSFPEKIDMAFKHAQAYLVFNLKAANAASENITITNVELQGVYTSGTITIARQAPATYADDNIDTTWASKGGAASAAYQSIAYNPVGPVNQSAISLALDDAAYQEMGHLLIVPKDKADTQTKLKISYTLGGNNYTYEYEIAEDTYEAGKKYIYNITFNLHEIRIAPVVTDWDADINGDHVANDDVNIIVPSVAYNTTANVSIGNTEGTYTFTISNVPAAGGSTYSFVEDAAASDDLDFIDGAVTIVENTTASAVGYITLKFKSTGGADGKKHLLKLKLGDDVKMTITLNLSATAID